MIIQKNDERTVKIFAEIESKLVTHGGDRNLLLKKAQKLSQSTTMSLLEAVEKIIYDDNQTRIKPIGVLNFDNSKR